jgi:hypothetical protein
MFIYSFISLLTYLINIYIIIYLLNNNIENKKIIDINMLHELFRNKKKSRINLQAQVQEW